MNARGLAPAQLPPPGTAGLDARWSRLVPAVDHGGSRRIWHVLDTAAAGANAGAAYARATLLCVHGNPTWGYLWRSLLHGALPAEGWRVVAPDHLDMGFSERTDTRRRFAQRVQDLAGLTAVLDLTPPVVVVAHDWGGPIALAWALQHRELLGGIVLTNTAVHQPSATAAPALIRLARAAALRDVVTVRSPAFLAGTLALARPPLPAAVRAAYTAPYRDPARRVAIGDFVEDIPLDRSHPSWQPLAELRDCLADLATVPTLLLWGPDDPVFSDRYLDDLQARLPHADVHRFEGAGHLLTEDADVAGAVRTWLTARRVGTRPPAATPLPAVNAPTPSVAPAGGPLWAELDRRAADTATAIVQLDAGGTQLLSWQELHGRVRQLAAGLAAAGVQPGERVALLVPPGIDLAVAVYACWRAGAVIVLADAGLGLPGLRRALRGARPVHLIGIPRALAAARALRWPGRRIVAGELAAPLRTALKVSASLAQLTARGASAAPPPEPAPTADAAVLFTSGATGPAKGVVYRHHQLQAQRELLRRAYGITPADAFVAAFAPFALYGPALGIASAVPACDVTAPRTLTASALADAAAAIQATLVFGSPAALANAVATAGALDAGQRDALAGVRLLLSAGAPIPADLLRAAGALLPAAEAHTPYGMTEALPVTDIDLAGIEAANAQPQGGAGVCVGRPLPEVEVAIRPLTPAAPVDADGLTRSARITGELCVRAAHLRERYDRLWVTTAAASRPPGWHRTGDVGRLDDAGRVWVEGRLAHVIWTAGGLVTPVGPEQRIERLPQVRRAAVVGVGPTGTQQAVAVVELHLPARRPAQLTGAYALAPVELADAVRAAAGVPLAAVLLAPALPVDVRHNAKVDRSAVATRAGALLAGGG